jgi:hypothetical protein
MRNSWRGVSFQAADDGPFPFARLLFTGPALCALGSGKETMNTVFADTILRRLGAVGVSADDPIMSMGAAA